MTRKNRKGVVGKKIPTLHHKENVGVGIDFKQEHVADSAAIENVLKQKKKEQGLE